MSDRNLTKSFRIRTTAKRTSDTAKLAEKKHVESAGAVVYNELPAIPQVLLNFVSAKQIPIRGETLILRLPRSPQYPNP